MTLFQGFPDYAASKNLKALIFTTLRNSAVSKGKLYQAYARLVIPAGQTRFLSFTTADKTIKSYPSVLNTSADKFTFDYFEGASVSGGTPVSVFNQNRRTANTSEVVFLSDVTVQTEGTKIAQVWMPGAVGTGQSRSGASSGGGDTHWILKPNTTYLFKFINGSSAENTVQLNEIWIEGDL